MDPEDRPIRRAFRALRWAGVAPYATLQPPRLSSAFVLYGRLICLIYGGVYLSARVIDIVKTYKDTHDLSSVVSFHFVGNITIACTLGIIYVGMFQAPKRMCYMFQCLEDLRKIRQKVGSVKHLDYVQRNVFLLFVGIQILIALLTVYNILIWRDIAGDTAMLIFLVTILNSGYSISTLVLMPFVTVAMTIRMSFRAINEQLEELHSQLQSLGKLELAQEKLRSLMQMYVRTCVVVQKHNDSENELLAMFLVHIIVSLIVTVFFVMEFLDDSDTNFVPIALAAVMGVIMDVCRGMLLVAPSHAINLELQHTRALLCKLMSTVSWTSDTLVKELNIFLLQLTLNQPVYITLGIFPLTRPLIISMMAICATYQVVLGGLTD